MGERKLNIVSLVRWIRNTLFVFLSIIICVILIARAVTYFSNRIAGENGVDKGIYVTLGGQEQYLLVRGENADNPVMIWLHGGPGIADAYMNYMFQKYLVDDYTIINWDQRGCGRTYYRNAESDPDNDTATFGQAQIDLDELVDYACARFETNKVILVGHSYGTMLGSYYTLNHPEKVSAYIGVGQAVSMESELYSYEDALRIARENGDDTTAMEAAAETYAAQMTSENVISLRSYVSKYHVVENENNTLWEGLLSPHVGIDDLKWAWRQTGDPEGYFRLNQKLYEFIMATDVRDYGLEYQVPAGFISGAEDWITPVKVSEEYYQLISAPEKEFRLIEGCGHSPQYDDPERFCDALEGMLEEFEQLE